MEGVEVVIVAEEVTETTLEEEAETSIHRGQLNGQIKTHHPGVADRADQQICEL